VEESSDAHLVAIQKILDFLGDYYEDDISLLVMYECLIYLEDAYIIVSLQITN
jgi:hypothetical protein